MSQQGWEESLGCQAWTNWGHPTWGRESTAGMGSPTAPHHTLASCLGDSGIMGCLSTQTTKVNSLAFDTKLGWRGRDTKMKSSHCLATSQWSLGRSFPQNFCLLLRHFFFFLVKTHSSSSWPRRLFSNSPHKLSLLFQYKFSLEILQADSSLSWTEV